MTQPDHCPYCQAPPSYRVEVHGHVQCQRCGVNIQPCCDGAQAEPEAEKEDQND